MKLFLQSLFTVLVVCGTVSAYPRLGVTSGQAPCKYSESGISGDTSCAAAGVCNPQAINGPASVSAGWGETWSCGSGFVSASGYLNVVYDVYFNSDGTTSTTIPVGFNAGGGSTVTVYYPGGLSVSTKYSGWEEEDCDGTVEFTGGYEYSC